MNHVVWEYLTESADALADDDRLKALGADRWELITIHDGAAIFKRPGPDYRERITVAQRERLDAERDEDGE